MATMNRRYGRSTDRNRWWNFVKKSIQPVDTWEVFAAKEHRPDIFPFAYEPVESDIEGGVLYWKGRSCPVPKGKTVKLSVS
jgi:hypothetical protein